MGEKDMSNVGKQTSIIVDNLQWSPETAYLYKRPSYPAVSGGLLGQREVRTVIEAMPIAQGLVTRANRALGRVAAMREALEKELRT